MIVEAGHLKCQFDAPIFARNFPTLEPCACAPVAILTFSACHRLRDFQGPDFRELSTIYEKSVADGLVEEDQEAAVCSGREVGEGTSVITARPRQDMPSIYGSFSQRPTSISASSLQMIPQLSMLLMTKHHGYSCRMPVVDTLKLF